MRGGWDDENLAEREMQGDGSFELVWVVADGSSWLGLDGRMHGSKWVIAIVVWFRKFRNRVGIPGAFAMVTSDRRT